MQSSELPASKLRQPTNYNFKKVLREIAFITDIHLDEDFPKKNGVNARKNWEIILKDISSKNITEIIFGGDIGKPTSNKWFFETLNKFELSIILGNHDKFAETIKYYKIDLLPNQSELYYSIENDYFKNIFLDTSADSFSLTQFEWFQKEIKTLKKILLFVHHPIFKINTAVDKLYPLKGRDELKNELLKLENEIFIFCGHCHMIDERKQNNITQIMTLASSFQIDKNEENIKVNAETFGYRVLKIETGKIETELIIMQNE